MLRSLNGRLYSAAWAVQIAGGSDHSRAPVDWELTLRLTSLPCTTYLLQGMYEQS